MRLHVRKLAATCCSDAIPDIERPIGKVQVEKFASSAATVSGAPSVGKGGSRLLHAKTWVWAVFGDVGWASVIPRPGMPDNPAGGIGGISANCQLVLHGAHSGGLADRPYSAWQRR